MRRFTTLAITAALAVAPAIGFAADSDVSPSPNAGAPSSIPDATIGKAGAALHDVAKLQEKYQGQFDQASPDQRKNLSAQANAEAMQAIQSRGLSVQEYSSVVHTAQNNPQIKQRLLQAARETQ